MRALASVAALLCLLLAVLLAATNFSSPMNSATPTATTTMKHNNTFWKEAASIPLRTLQGSHLAAEAEAVPLGSLCAGGRAGLAGAHELSSSLGEELRARDVALVGIGHELLGVEEFLAGGYWKGDHLLLDTRRQLYQAFGASRSSVLGLLRPSFWSAASRADGKGFKGDLAGDGWQLGGTFVVDCQSGELVFQHHQQGFGEHADLDQLMQSVKQHFPRRQEQQKEAAAL
ncbi:Peroxiredoxin-like 2 activated in M-CSF stimulated monocytes [Balamuthia mandrillaris]